MIAKFVGEELAGCKWVGVPFAGGMTELLYLDARTIVVSDLHRHIMNLACVVASEESRRHIVKALNDLPFHPDTLKYAQAHCLEMERGGWSFDTLDAELSERWAVNFFVCAWMGRNGTAGTKSEFRTGFSVRWNANGGDSCGRFRSAARSLVGWRNILRRCTFQCLDVFEFLGECQDLEGHGLYCDPPFPDTGGDYRYKFTEAQHIELAKRLGQFRRLRVVCRFYDHPLVHQLYPEGSWLWRELGGRDQANQVKKEVLLMNGPSYAASQRSLF
uniref:site-specific DNA-methyltransferase (adenine-specific) n=1 Tax=viral metagenome TaxID=1070528 RepID=A0A6M3LNR2_9ZZZZ